MIPARATASLSMKVVVKVIAAFFLGIILLGFVSFALAAQGCQGTTCDLSNGKAGVRRLIPSQIRGIQDLMPSGETENKPPTKRRPHLRTSGDGQIPSPMPNRPFREFFFPLPPSL
ncbi:hypothetical protein Nepgr_018617 [Nepenthes gracilis]|uniref:Uncharacterized protein n=1 Tax=Nepenthes gracilis TaxID=150966 RepID=A0AAD3SVF8_NEPGR|nr:hypothetical protein Nepgr_018617 [Nepenthes gracilis]